MLNYILGNKWVIFVQSISWALFVFLIFLVYLSYKKKIKLSKFRNNQIRMTLLENFLYYSGISFIVRKFVPDNDSALPTGVIWFCGLYFAVFTLTAQRFETRLNRLEYQYNIFATQLAAKNYFNNRKLRQLLTTPIPYESKIWNPISVINSACFPLVFKYYYSTFEIPKWPEVHMWKRVKYSIMREWRSSLAGAQLSNGTFEKIFLDNINFKGTIMENANFKEAYLPKSNMQNAYLMKANFQDAKLYSANFQGAIMRYANFKSAFLANSNFKNTDVIEVNFEETDITGVRHLTAEQLVCARSLYRIKGCPKEIEDKIKDLGFAQMINKKPENWSDSLKSRRVAFINKWIIDVYGKASMHIPITAYPSYMDMDIMVIW